MGDRCYVTLHFRAKDKSRIKAITDELGELGEPNSQDDGSMEWEEINYAGHSAWGVMEQKLKGIPWYVQHTVGCEYGAGYYAFDGNELAIGESSHDGSPVVITTKGGDLIGLDNAKLAWKVWEEVNA